MKLRLIILSLRILLAASFNYRASKYNSAINRLQTCSESVFICPFIMVVKNPKHREADRGHFANICCPPIVNVI